MKREASEFVWGWREGYLPVRTRYMSTYCFYQIEMFWPKLNWLQLFYMTHFAQKCTNIFLRYTTVEIFPTEENTYENKYIKRYILQEESWLFILFTSTKSTANTIWNQFKYPCSRSSWWLNASYHGHHWISPREEKIEIETV